MILSYEIYYLIKLRQLFLVHLSPEIGWFVNMPASELKTKTKKKYLWLSEIPRLET
jgi:hypothetical protein